jgi:hypothetical protein
MMCKEDTGMYTGLGGMSLCLVASCCSGYLHWDRSRGYKRSREGWTPKSLWAEVECIILGSLDCDPPERYWSFPFIASREGPVIHQRGWREKKEKNKRERGGVPELCCSPSPASGPWRSCRWWGHPHTTALLATSPMHGCRGSIVTFHTT